MKTETKAAPAATANGNVPWENFVKFVRQLSHDLRNPLNAAELQSALIGELTNDAELKSEVRRLRELVSQLGVTLQSLSASVAEPRPTALPYAAKDFIADMQKKIAHEFPEKGQAVTWEILPAGATLNIDPELTEWAAAELFRNAFRHDPSGDEVQAQASVEGDWFTFSIRETKKEEIDPIQWTQPLQKVSHGHYGLGLRRARRIITAQGGELTAKFDPVSRTLTSTITLPCSAESP
jgi:K+-sensing histidine kinase KdpD